MVGSGADSLVVVTGGNGFIGRALCAHFLAAGRRHRRLVRLRPAEAMGGGEAGAETLAMGDLAIAADAQLDAALAGATAVVHLAGRAHVLADTAPDPVACYEAANTQATARLAAAAARVGVQRFVFASTVKVLGEQTRPGAPFRADAPVAPMDPYARSKLAAEHALRASCAGSTMRPIVLRLPLVYGPGVGGNFLRLIDAVARRVPLPFGAVTNRRDLLFVGNLVHVIAQALDCADPPDGTWLISDGAAISTPELIRRVAAALGVAARLLPVPVALLEVGASLAGRRAQIERLTRSLEVDASALRQQLGACPFTLDQGLAETARWWRGRHAI